MKLTINQAASLGALLIAIYILFGGSFTSSVSKRKSKKKSRTSIPGLVNLGNTCFLNCILQALACCQSFLKWLQPRTIKTSPILLQSLENIIRVLNGEKEDGHVSAVSVLKALKFHGWVISAEEQDAHELFHALTSTLNDEMALAWEEAGSLLNLSWVDSEVNSNTPLASEEPQQGSTAGKDIDVPFPKMNEGVLHKLKEMNHESKQSIILKVPSSAHEQPSLLRGSPSLETPFKGHLVSQLECTVCGYKNAAQWSTFESLSLSLLPSSWSSPKCSLHDLLDSFVRSESVVGVTCDGCSKTSGSPTQTTFSKKLSIGKLPDCLCIHIQRTVWLENGCTLKRKDFVDVPEFLNMGTYTYGVFINHQIWHRCLSDVAYFGYHEVRSLISEGNLTTSHSLEATPKQNIRGGLLGGRQSLGSLHSSTSKENDFSLKLLDSVVSSSCQMKDISSRNGWTSHSLYKLQAVVVHLGDVFSGHFVTYRRGSIFSNTSREKWFYTSDVTVKEVSLEEVLDSNPYMVIYERVF